MIDTRFQTPTFIGSVPHAAGPSKTAQAASQQALETHDLVDLALPSPAAPAAEPVAMAEPARGCISAAAERLLDAVQSAVSSTVGSLAGASVALYAKNRKPHSGDNRQSNRPPITDLKEIADRSMEEAGMLTDFSVKEQKQLNAITGAARPTDPAVRDLRSMQWCSIDNDDSRDLDQVEVAERLPNGDIKVLVGIADVDALVPSGSPLDLHARNNTTTVYTSDKIFPMLPERLSTDLTSLNFSEDRAAVVTEMVIAADGTVKSSDMYRAMINNKSKLAYDSVAAWLDGKGPEPPRMSEVAGMADQVRLQDEVAKRINNRRHEAGALGFESIETHAKMENGKVVDLVVNDQNRARQLIEDLMVASNGVAARFLESRNFPTLRRVVKEPKHWDGIVELAAGYGEKLPATPDSKALEAFLVSRRAADPLRFPDLSLSVVKLMGAGEYVIQQPNQPAVGHFGLAVKDYSHSTAPNRRYPDIITQRLLKAAIANQPCPYSAAELDELAQQCTTKEHDAVKVERQVRKSAAALLMSDKIGEQFDALVSDKSDKGTFIRVLNPPVDGKLKDGGRNLEAGSELKVKVTGVNVERGFIDFEQVTPN